MHLNAGTDEEFIRLLRELHARRLPGKHENFLLSPAHFDPDRTDVGTRRGLDNIRHVRGVWLDNDGGDLTHAEFARLLPSLRIVAWNTFSSTRARPRWRCFIPTTEAMTPAVYQAIIEQIMQVLRYAGYVSDAEKLKRPTLKTHGFDTGKFVASSLFYAPCQAAEPRASFFHDYDEAGRTSIDPGLWIERDIRDPAPELPDPRSHGETKKYEENIQAIQQATDRWRSTPRGQGNRAFYRFGQELSRAGLNPQAIRTRLLAEARNSASPRDRTADARRMFRQLKK